MTRTTAPLEGQITSIAAHLPRLGYLLGPPPGLSASALSADHDAARCSRCDACGWHGLQLVTFHRTAPRSYRAFALCPSCSHAVEF